jgi:hypothetical protein
MLDLGLSSPTSPIIRQRPFGTIANDRPVYGTTVHPTVRPTTPIA